VNNSEPLVQAATGEHALREATGVRLRARASVATSRGELCFVGFEDLTTRAEHIAVVAGRPFDDAPLVYVHSECLIGEAFGALNCDCGLMLGVALDAVERDGGVLIYLRHHESQGNGLARKPQASPIQEHNSLSSDASVDSRSHLDDHDYVTAAAILDELGIPSARMLTDEPAGVDRFGERGIDVVEWVPFEPPRGWRDQQRTRSVD
jgi:3,4-dihydroxy 2-butanone 4-phosphate synthase/GTP cyclohydrolase II